ncbi:MAG: hypothetical protein VKJ27_09760 [Synechocystis sp.]|nr:hypothetical protein [Synechocystis sp.]
MATSSTLTRPCTDSLQKPVYEAPQQVQYLYLEAEIDVLLRQLQSLQRSHNG